MSIVTYAHGPKSVLKVYKNNIISNVWEGTAARLGGSTGRYISGLAQTPEYNKRARV